MSRVTSNDIDWRASDAESAHDFQRVADGHYRLDVPEYATVFDVARFHRDHNDLCAEIVVSSQLKGARTFNGTIFSGSVNLSNAYRRRDAVRQIADRAGAKDVDWEGLLYELQVRVVAAEREGEPPRLLSTYDRPAPEDVFELDGLVLPRRHPSILFGDGGTFKSYLGLLVAGLLARQGVRVLFADWELDGSDHRERLENLFGAEMPPIYYGRYQRPLVDEAEGMARFVNANGIEYVVCDSVGFACVGAPESAEAAMGYFRGVRQFGRGVGSLHLAHVTKPKDDAPDPTKPFGSVFWHNSARSTWYVKRTTDTSDGSTFALQLTHRKANLGALRPAVGLQITFGQGSTAIQRIDVADVEEFAKSLPVWQRMRRALQSGPPLTIDALAEEIGAQPDHVRREAQRKQVRGARVFTEIDRGDGVKRVALLTDRAA